MKDISSLVGMRGGVETAISLNDDHLSSRNIVYQPERKTSCDIFTRCSFGHFKDLLEKRGVLERWYKFEYSNQREALKEWCVRHEISFVE